MIQLMVIERAQLNKVLLEMGKKVYSLVDLWDGIDIAGKIVTFDDNVWIIVLYAERYRRLT